MTATTFTPAKFDVVDFDDRGTTIRGFVLDTTSRIGLIRISWEDPGYGTRPAGLRTGWIRTGNILALVARPTPAELAA